MTSPWERLREAAEDFVGARDEHGWSFDADSYIKPIREALAALPATPPEQPATEEQPDDLGLMRDAKGLSERCRELRDRLVRLAQPVPAPPASDWRKRFNKWDRGRKDADATDETMVSLVAMVLALHDGLAALEAEVAKLKEKP